MNFKHALALIFSSYRISQYEIEILIKHLPNNLPVWNCSSSAGSTLAVFCLVSYFFCTFLLRFLFKIASSSAVCN